MTQFIALPEEVAAFFGSAGPKFVDFLTSTFTLQKEGVIAVSAMQFDNRLVRETSQIRLDMAEFRSETRTAFAGLRAETQTAIAELRTETQTATAELHTSIAELRAEMKADFAGVQKDIAGLHGQIAGLHREISGLHGLISAQTRWMLAGLAAAVTLYPIVTKLIGRLLP